MPRNLYQSEILLFFNRFNYDQLSTIRGTEHASIEVTGHNNKTYVATYGYNKNNDPIYKLKVKK